ncbi:MAG: hypothetical protein K0B11_08135 [Mariniphaga sp.]|nr:hypothetical protein [Mariniphaga sp.]
MKKLVFAGSVFIMMLVLGGCIYDWVVPPEVPEIPDDVGISFVNEILPIFTTGNNCTACHRTGGQMPDLTENNAFNSINSAKYINLTQPEESLIYKNPAPNSSTHRHKVYSGQQAALILAWIKQGAKNN